MTNPEIEEVLSEFITVQGSIKAKQQEIERLKSLVNSAECELATYIAQYAKLRRTVIAEGENGFNENTRWLLTREPHQSKVSVVA